MRLYGDKALDQTGLAYLWQKILNLVKKSVPTKISQLENDKKYITEKEVPSYTKEEMDSLLSGKENVIPDLKTIRTNSRSVEHKADKVSNTSYGRLAGLNSSGNLIDSGIDKEDVPDEELTISDINSLIQF